MPSFSTWMTILMVCSIKLTDTVISVQRCVRVDQVHDNENTKTMSFINHVFDIIRCTWSGRNCEKVCYVISKWCIIWMLLNGHKLNTIISCIFDTRKDIISKLSIGWYFRILRAHANVSFIYFQAFRHLWSCCLPLITFRWVPKYSIIESSSCILSWEPSPCWNSIYSFPITLSDASFKSAFMLNR